MNKPLAALAGIMTISLLLAGCGGQVRPVSAGMPNMPGEHVANRLSPSTGSTLPPAQSTGGTATPNDPSTVLSPPSTSITPAGIETPSQAGVGAAPPTNPSPLTTLAQLSTGELYGVVVVSHDRAYVAAPGGIFETQNGGRSWAEVLHSTDNIEGIMASPAKSGAQSVVAWTKSDLLVATAGASFRSVPVRLQNGQAASIGQVTVMSNGTCWVVDDGHVYQVTSDGTAILIETPVNMQAIAAADGQTCYAIGADEAIYKTTDGGQSWTQVFWPPLNGQLPWKVQVQVSGSHVAVLYDGGDAAVGESAFILCVSNDSGQGWQPLLDEGSFAHDYGNPQPLIHQTISVQAGGFTLSPSGAVQFVGRNARGEWVCTTVASDGSSMRSHDIQPASSLDPDSPVTVSASSDGQVMMVAGSAAGQGVVEVSGDGGATWRQS